MAIIEVYRVLPFAAPGPYPAWHNTAKLHIEQPCGVNLLRPGARLIRQRFNTEDIVDIVYCARCGKAYREEHDILNIGHDARMKYLRGWQKRWRKAFTAEFETIGYGLAEL